MKVDWPTINAKWEGWFDATLLNSKEASKKGTATGTLTLAGA